MINNTYSNDTPSVNNFSGFFTKLPVDIICKIYHYLDADIEKTVDFFTLNKKIFNIVTTNNKCDTYVAKNISKKFFIKESINIKNLEKKPYNKPRTRSIINNIIIICRQFFGTNPNQEHKDIKNINIKSDFSSQIIFEMYNRHHENLYKQGVTDIIPTNIGLNREQIEDFLKKEKSSKKYDLVIRYAYEEVSEKLALEALHNFPSVFSILNENFKKNEKFIETAIENKIKLNEIVHIKEEKGRITFESEWKNNRNLAIKIVSMYPYAFQCFDSFLDDEEVLTAALCSKSEIKEAMYPLRYASERLRNDSKKVCLAISRSVFGFKYASKERQNDSEIIRYVQENNVKCFKFFNEKWRNDFQTALDAIKKNYKLSKHIGNSLKGNVQIALAGLKNCKNASGMFLDEQIRCDIDKMSLLVKEWGPWIIFADLSIRFEPQLVRLAMQKNPQSCNFAPVEMMCKQDEDILLMWLENKKLCKEYKHKYFLSLRDLEFKNQDSKKIVEYFVKLQYKNFKFASNRLKNDVQFIIELLHYFKENDNHIQEEFYETLSEDIKNKLKEYDFF